MRTTLKRGIGRSTAVNGNGRAVLPPAVFAPVRRYAQPPFRRSGWRRVGRLLLGLLAIVVLLALGSAGGAYLYFHESVAAVAAHSKDVKLASKNLDIPLPNEPAIALVLGYDARLGPNGFSAAGSRSDTVMLLRADPTTNSVSMLSFPRDLKTELWCGNKIVGVDRINTAYAICGSKGTLETVKHLTGLPINYLITVDFVGFIQIVDRVGGVWIDVDRRYYNRNVGTAGTNFANINLQPGYQKLSGRDALAYVRFRHTDSDLFRIARQQQFVKALKQAVSSHFSVFTALKVVGAITHNIEIGSTGAGSLEGTVRRYALFAYGLPSGHFFQTKIGGLQGANELYAPPSDIAAAVADFSNPDVQAPQKATAVSLGQKASGLKAPPPNKVTVNVLNGNGITGSASTAGYLLSQRGFQIIVPATATDRNAPTFDYFHTIVYYDKAQPSSNLAAQTVANLFGDADVTALPANLRQRAAGAMIVVVVGSTFHGTISPAPLDHTPAKEAPSVRTDSSNAAATALKSVSKDVGFELMVPTVLERTSYLDREVPVRVYDIEKHEKAVRLTFLSGTQLAGYWGVTETKWSDAPILQQPNLKHVIDGRKYSFYFSGPHLHMIVLKYHGVNYWITNTLLDSLSNETMIAIAKHLKPLTTGK